MLLNTFRHSDLKEAPSHLRLSTDYRPALALPCSRSKNIQLKPMNEDAPSEGDELQRAPDLNQT